MRVMLIIGIVFLVIAGASIYVALQPSEGLLDVGHEAAPILALTFGIIGVVFTLVGFFVTRMGAARQQLLEQGIPGRATVVSAAETGMYVNERPMVKLVLNVAVPGRPPYTVEHSEVVPFIALGMITPGSSLPVAVDQVNPKKLVIDWSGETQARASAAMGGQMGFGGICFARDGRWPAFVIEPRRHADHERGARGTAAEHAVEHARLRTQHVERAGDPGRWRVRRGGHQWWRRLCVAARVGGCGRERSGWRSGFGPGAGNVGRLRFAGRHQHERVDAAVGRGRCDVHGRHAGGERRHDRGRRSAQ